MSHTTAIDYFLRFHDSGNVTERTNMGYKLNLGLQSDGCEVPAHGEAMLAVGAGGVVSFCYEGPRGITPGKA
jgi:hypothetical protein